MARISAALRGGGRKKWAISAPVSSRRGIEGATRAIPSWIGRGLVWVVEREREGAFARDRRGSCAASVPTLITSWQRTLSYLHTHTLTLSQTLTYYELILLISLDNWTFKPHVILTPTSANAKLSCFCWLRPGRAGRLSHWNESDCFWSREIMNIEMTVMISFSLDTNGWVNQYFN